MDIAKMHKTGSLVYRRHVGGTQTGPFLVLSRDALTGTYELKRPDGKTTHDYHDRLATA